MVRLVEPKTDADLAGAPIARQVRRLADAGHRIEIEGWTPDGHYALVVDRDSCRVAVASFHTVNGIGRFECALVFLEEHGDYIRRRFSRAPVR